MVYKAIVVAVILVLIACTGLWRVPWALANAGWQLGSASVQVTSEIRNAERQVNDEVHKAVSLAVEEQLESTTKQIADKGLETPATKAAMTLLKLGAAVAGVALAAGLVRVQLPRFGWPIF